jgi:dihydrofolate reductase
VDEDVGGAEGMSRVVVINHLTLDGVMQAPGRPEEDTRDGFAQGGWSAPNVDDQLLAATHARVAESGGLRLLLGRRSYEDMLGYWNTQDSPFKDGLNNAPKYVASRTLREPLPWPSSTLLRGDVAGTVLDLKHKLTGHLTVMGSGEFLQTLMRHDLIDEYLLFIHPLVLGTGRRLFSNGVPPASLRLIESNATTTGVMIARYEKAGSTASPPLTPPGSTATTQNRTRRDT